MPAKKSKPSKKQTRPAANNSQRAAQILFSVIAVVVILSMVFSVVSNL